MLKAVCDMNDKTNNNLINVIKSGLSDLKKKLRNER